ncbi:MAG: DUF192 domain-containing protein [Gammaproteobacteria bacterium]
MSIQRCAIVIALSLLSPPSVHAARPASYLRDFGQARAIIETSNNICVVLDIYLADSREQHGQGLMFIDQMDELEGMLFRYSRVGLISMWMKNTHIPLDMLFIRGDGEIAGIARNTTPMSTKTITSPEPVPFVLELNGGMTERWKIETGNRLLAIN